MRNIKSSGVTGEIADTLQHVRRMVPAHSHRGLRAAVLALYENRKGTIDLDHRIGSTLADFRGDHVRGISPRGRPKLDHSRCFGEGQKKLSSISHETDECFEVLIDFLRWDVGQYRERHDEVGG